MLLPNHQDRTLLYHYQYILRQITYILPVPNFHLYILDYKVTYYLGLL